MKKYFSILLAAILIFGCVSCSKKEKKAEFEIWSPYVTEKIYRDIAYDANKKTEAYLNISMAKNEYESDQLIISAKSAIGSYDLHVSDLVDGKGNIIPKEDISVYMQHYINVTKKNNYNNDYPVGYTPDALIPMEYATKKRENKIEKDKNQGLYITVKTQADTVSGKYTGSFELVADGTVKEIPVTVNVWDFTVPDSVNTQSCFMLNRNDIMNGELDNTEEMYKTYYETMLRYRISPMYVPGYDRGIESYLQSIQYYYDRPGFSAYGIAHSSNGQDIDYIALKEMLKSIAYICTEETVYLEKAYYYIYDLIDEPHNYEGGGERAAHIIKSIDDTEELAIEELNKEGFFQGKSEDFRQRVEKAMRNIPDVVTTYYDESFAETPLTWCPTVEHFNDLENRELYAEEQERKGSLWWYTCASPNFPHPSYHIDDNLIGARILSWMQKAYNIDGNLYWATTTYNKIELNAHGEDNITRPVDPYGDPQRMSERWIANGDGYLFYPGKKYGADHPFASLRLEAIRDGLEEYEYLNLLEEMYATASGYYDLEISAAKTLAGIYDRLFSGTIYSQDHALFSEMRDILAEEILQAQDNPAKFYITDIEKRVDFATVKFVADSGFTATVNGREVTGVKTGGGYLYSAEVPLDKKENYADITLSNGTDVYDYHTYLSGEVEKVSCFDDAEELNKFRPSRTVEIFYSEEIAVTGGSMKIVADADDKLGYYPTVTLDAKTLQTPIDSVDAFEFSVYNAGNEGIKLTLVLLSNSSEYVVTQRTLRAKEWTNISIGQLYAVNWSGISDVVGIQLRLENYVDENTLMPRQILYVDNVTLTKRNSV